MKNIFLSLSWPDYFIVTVIVVSTIISLIRGFIREVLSLITWIVAFIIAFKFCDNLAIVFTSAIQTPSLRLAISFAILFIVTLILGGLLSYLLTHLLTKTGLSGTDRLLGMLFGVARGVLVIAVLLLLLDVSTKTMPLWWKQSLLIPHFHDLIEWLRTFLPDKIAHLTNAATTAIATKATS